MNYMNVSPVSFKRGIILGTGVNGNKVALDTFRAESMVANPENTVTTCYVREGFNKSFCPTMAFAAPIEKVAQAYAKASSSNEVAIIQ